MKFITHALVVLWLGTICVHAAPPPPPAGTANFVAQLPVGFERNDGQTDARAKFLLRTPGYAAFFNEREVVFSFRHKERRTKRGRTRSHTVATSVMQISLVGANPHASLTASEELPGRANYLLGSDESNWRTDVPLFTRLTAENIYPGIDLTYYGSARDLEYDFVVRPGADVSAIRLRFAGRTTLTVGDEGELRVAVDGRELATWRAPVAYQQIAGTRRAVTCSYVLRAGRELGFTTGEYDRSAPLVIDPVLLYASFLGGSGAEAAEAITVYSNTVYVVGGTTSLNFPAPGGYRTNAYASNDVFIARFNSSGTGLIFATYLGGGGDDFGNSIVVDPNGNVCVTGLTDSENFPVRNQFQSSLSGDSDAFVTRLAAAGNALLYSTYFGGNGYEAGNAITLGGSGGIYIAGETDSEAQFPKKNPFQNNAGGLLDGFLARFNPTVSGGSSLVFASWIGGADDDRATGIDVDGSYFYVCGEISALDFFSSDFPVKNAFQPEYGGGGSDAWVAKLPLAGTSISWASHLGGYFEDAAATVVVDGAGQVTVVGTTASDNFPVLNAQQPVIGGGGSFYTSDAFVARVAPNGTNILYATFLGGEVEEHGSGIGVDANGLVYVTGQTTSTNFPVSGGALQTAYNGGPGDAFVAKLNPAVPGRNGIVYSTYFGGLGTEDPGLGNCLFVTTNGDYFFVGTTTSTNGFPSTNAFKSTFEGGYSDAFIAKLASQSDLSVSVSASIEPVLVGSNLTYTVRVNNNSRTNFTAVVLTNFLADTVNYVTAAASRGTVTRTGRAVVWSIGAITNHGAATMTLTIQTTEPRVITNVAVLTATEPEVNSANNTDRTVTTVRGIADVALAKTAHPNPVFASSNLIYTFTVTNRGPWNATDVLLETPMPDDSDFLFATTTLGFMRLESGVVKCFVPVLTNGAALSVTLAVAPAAGVITNLSTISAFELDLAPEDNEATTVTTVDPVGELVVTMAAAPDPVLVSSNLIITATVSNRGPSTATGIVITNVLPPNLTFVTGTLPRGSVSHSNGLVVGTVSAMTNSQRVTLTIVARANAAGTATIPLGVRSAVYDPIEANNAAEVMVTIDPLADLRLTGAAAPPVLYASERFTFAFDAANIGPSPATNVVITVNFPASVSVASASSPQGACAISGSRVVCEIAALATNDGARVTIEAVPSAGGFVTAVGNVTSGVADTFISDNFASATVQALPLPRLAVRYYRPNIVAVSWLASFTNFVPEFSTHFPYPLTNGLANWMAVTNEIVSTNGVNTFTNLQPDVVKTFRLRRL